MFYNLIGKISMIQLIMDQDTGRSKGYGFITYAEAEDAKKALEQVLYALFYRFGKGNPQLKLAQPYFSIALIRYFQFQMNGFELAGRAMKVGHVTDRTDGQLGGIAGQGGKTLQ